MSAAKISILGILAVLIFSFIAYAAPRILHETYDATAKKTLTENSTSTVVNAVPEIEKDVVKHVATPESVKAIYMTSCVVGTPSFRDQLVKIADTTEINSIVIDIKDYSGKLSWKPNEPALAGFFSDRCGAPDMKEFIKLLHEKGIYVIGRITAFQDPYYAKIRPDLAVKKASNGALWPDRKGINYLDPGSKEVWDHLITIGKASYEIGFDELNYDYIRFPSDGNMKDIAFPFSGKRSKQEVLQDFFKYLNENLKPTGAVLSGDLFGFTTTNTDDLNIGQILERAFLYFDYVAPMVYPSHYPPTFMNYKNPAAHPYEVVKYAMGTGVVRALATSSIYNLPGSEPIASTSPELYTREPVSKNKLRPWLQDFDLGATYTADMVRLQIQATYDVGLNSWMLWDPANKYTVEALHKE